MPLKSAVQGLAFRPGALLRPGTAGPGLNRLRKKTRMPGQSEQGLKPDVDFAAFAARLKSGPCYKTSEFVCMSEFFRSL